MNNSFASLLHPYGVEEFFANDFELRAKHIPGDPAKFTDLFDISRLNAVLTAAKSPHPTLRVVEMEKKHLIENSRDILENVRDGRTLILEEVDRHDAGVMRFANAMAKDLGEDTRVNLYLSPQGHQGFKIHYDTQDVFALQISGTKRWRVYEPTLDSPLFFMREHGIQPPDEDKKYLECVMEPGDLLYIPRGHWHDAFAQEEASMHLTLSVFVRTGIDVLAWLTNELRQDPAFRKSLPVAYGQANERMQDDHPHHHAFATLADRVSAFLRTPAAVLAHDRERVHSQRDRHIYDLSHQLSKPDWESLRQTNLVPHVRPYTIHESAASAEIAIAGMTLRLPIQMGILAQQILQQREPFRPCDLQAELPQFSESVLADLITTFVQRGLLVEN